MLDTPTMEMILKLPSYPETRNILQNLVKTYFLQFYFKQNKNRVLFGEGEGLKILGQFKFMQGILCSN